MMDKTFIIAERTQKIIDLLKENGFSKRTINALKLEKNCFLVGDMNLDIYDYIQKGDTLCVVLPKRDTVKIPKKDVGISILFENADYIVIYKPAGVASTPTFAHFASSIYSGLVLIYGENFIPRVITRLDKDTSGLMLIAKNAVAQWNVQRDMSAIHREYTALVEGTISDGGIIDAPIGIRTDVQTNRTVRCVHTNGKNAITKYTVLKNFAKTTLIRLVLQTGRTHQIRIHMAHIQHPIVGDPIYGTTTGTNAENSPANTENTPANAENAPANAKYSITQPANTENALLHTANTENAPANAKYSITQPTNTENALLHTANTENAPANAKYSITQPTNTENALLHTANAENALTQQNCEKTHYNLNSDQMQLVCTRLALADIFDIKLDNFY